MSERIRHRELTALKKEVYGKVKPLPRSGNLIDAYQMFVKRRSHAVSAAEISPRPCVVWSLPVRKQS